MKHLRRCTISG